MNGHEQINDLLPQFAAGSLDERLLGEVSLHLETCQECQADLRFWTALSAEIHAQNQRLSLPDSLAAEVLKQFQPEREQTKKVAGFQWKQAIRRGIDLLRIQAPLVRRELWPASVIVILIGVAVAYLLGNALVIRLLAPMVAAASLAVLYGPENDPAIELTLSCPTSQRQVLLARVALVFSYNLVLGLFASLALKFLIPPGLFGSVILSWLGPMAFLSTAALLLSIWVGTNNAITLTYIAWIGQFLPDLQLQLITGWEQWLAPAAQIYRQFWTNPLLLLASACGLLVLAMWSTSRPDHDLPHLT